MQVLLVVPPFAHEQRYGKVATAASDYHSLGLAYLAQLIRNLGHQVNVLECEANRLTMADVENFLRDMPADLIGLQTFNHNWDACQAVARLAKEVAPQAKVVMGGLHATMFPEEVLVSDGVDFVVVGEGEAPLKALLEILAGSKPLNGVPGLCYREADGSLVVNQPAQHIKVLDQEVALPALDLFPLYAYHSSAQLRGHKTLHLVTSRGCPYPCSFCNSNKTFGPTWRGFSAERILQEVKLLIEQYGVDVIQFFDDVFTYDRQRTLDFCRLIQAEGIELAWSCFTRTDLVDPELLAEMKKAGCYQIFIGLESGVPRLLKMIKKGTTPDSYREGFKMVMDAGIEIFASVILGLPTETPEEAERTLEFAIETDPTWAYWFNYTPWPGTDLYDFAVAHGTVHHPELAKYTIHYPEPVYVPHGWTREKLQEFEQRAMRRFYLRPRKMIKLLNQFRHLPLKKMFGLARGGIELMFK